MPAKKKRIMRKVKPYSSMDEITDALVSVLGSDAVHSGSESDLGEPRFYIPSGVPELDLVLHRGRKGWPGGRIVEIYGAEATCKTGIGYALIAQAQKMGGAAAIYPTEGNFDGWLCKQYGVDLSKVVIGDDPTVEGVFASYRKAMRIVGRRGIFIGMIDSIANLSTRAELEDESFDRDRAAQIRAMQISKAMRKVGPETARNNSILFCVNQVRDNTDATPGKPKPPGGKALKFLASVRIRLEILGKVYRQRKGQKYVAGFKLRVTSEKNRLATPFQQANIVLDYERGLQSAKAKKKRK